MKTKHMIAVLVGVAAISICAADASAMYHPGMGVFMQRDPGVGAGGPMRIGTAGISAMGTFIPRDPAPLSPAPSELFNDDDAAAINRLVHQAAIPSEYIGGMNLYIYAGGNPVVRRDPTGLYYGYNPDNCEKKYCLNECGAWKCNKAKRQADDALADAQRLFPADSLHNGEGDAWRHCYWNCKMVRKIGDHCAKYIADQHEEAGNRGGQPPSEADMDYHNNHIGRGLGSQKGSCTDLCMKALKDGRLKKLK